MPILSDITKLSLLIFSIYFITSNTNEPTKADKLNFKYLYTSALIFIIHFVVQIFSIFVKKIKNSVMTKCFALAAKVISLILLMICYSTYSSSKNNKINKIIDEIKTYRNVTATENAFIIKDHSEEYLKVFAESQEVIDNATKIVNSNETIGKTAMIILSIRLLAEIVFGISAIRLDLKGLNKDLEKEVKIKEITNTGNELSKDIQSSRDNL